jgi:hypothetical protein
VVRRPEVDDTLIQRDGPGQEDARERQERPLVQPKRLASDPEERHRTHGVDRVRDLLVDSDVLKQLVMESERVVEGDVGGARARDRDDGGPSPAQVPGDERAREQGDGTGAERDQAS